MEVDINEGGLLILKSHKRLILFASASFTLATGTSTTISWLSSKWRLFGWRIYITLAAYDMGILREGGQLTSSLIVLSLLRNIPLLGGLWSCTSLGPSMPMSPLATISVLMT